MVELLADYESGPFSDRERAALRYADALYMDHHGITDDQFQALREHFDDQEAVELTMALVQFIALGKLIYVFGTPYGDSSSDDLGLDHDTQEGTST